MNLILMIILLVIAVLFSSIEILIKKEMYLVYWILVIFFAFICATRSLITQDTIPYILGYNDVSINYFYTSINETPLRFDLGYTILMQVFKILFGGNYKIFFFFIVIINYLIILLAYKKICEIIGYKKTYIITLFTLYTSYFGIYYNGIVLRAGIAISFIIYSTSFFLEKKYIRGAFLGGIALFMHDSSILASIIILILFFRKSFTKKTYYIFLTLLLIITVTESNAYILKRILPLLEIWVNKYEFLHVFKAYIVNSSMTFGISFKLIYFILIGYVYIFLNLFRNIYINKFINIYFFGLLIAVIFNGLDVFSRISDFYIIYNCIIFLLFFSEEVKSKKSIYINIFGIWFIVFCNFALICRVVNLVI